MAKAKFPKFRTMELPADTPPDLPGRSLVAQMIVNGLQQGSDPEAERIEQLRERCRQGNPFPLVAVQWPELVIADPDDAQHFEGRIGDADDPCLRLDYWQRDILRSVFDETIAEVFIKGNTKAGKGTSTSIAINLWFDVWKACKIILTSQRFDHAVDVIFGEVAAWRQRMKHPGPGRVLTQGISHTKQHYLTIANPQSGEGFSGQHGPRTLFCFDESTSIADSFYDDSQKQARKIMALANPRTLFGWFRSAYKPCSDPNITQTVDGPFGRRRCVTVEGSSCLNVRAKRLEKPLGPPGGIEIAGQQYAHNQPIPPDHYRHVRTLIPNQCDYGRYMGICQHPDPRHVAVFAHGHFPTEDPEKQLILSSWLERHEAAFRAAVAIPIEAYGLDVARSLDGDKTSLTGGGQAGIAQIDRWAYNDTTYHTAEVIRIARERHGIDLTLGRTPICVDMDGLGAGVGDQLRQVGVWVIEFRGNATSQVDPKRYANLRAESYATLARRLDPDDRWAATPFCLPPDDSLRQELVAPEKLYGSDGLRFHITPKQSPPGRDDVVSIKQKIGRSPDTADSVVYCFHAIRELHNLNAFFASFAGDLTVWPQPEPAVLQPGQKPPERETDLLSHLLARYGENSRERDD